MAAKANKPRRPVPWGELPRAGSEAPAGFLLIDKPSGATSHDVVSGVRRLAGTRKVGHAGTLDPMATGLLCIGIGKATRLLQYASGQSKEYEARICFGIATSTEDAQGDILSARGASSLTAQHVESAIADFRGDIMQVPSAVSAVKVQGKRAYDLVREGHTPELAARKVRITRLDSLSALEECERGGVACKEVDVRVECSSGTYIRALARDMGEALEVGAHLRALRRTRVGPWQVADALSMEALAAQVQAGEQLPVMPLSQVCRALFEVREVTPAEAENLRHGRFIDGTQSGICAALCAGEPVALLAPRGTKLKPELVFAS